MNRKFTLASRPETLPGPEHFAIAGEEMPPLADGQVRLRLAFAAVSPWQAQRCKDFANYVEPFAIGELISCDMLGEVVESKAAGWRSIHRSARCSGRTKRSSTMRSSTPARPA